MPAPSKLAIATSALQRLVKEEASYHKELEQQAARLTKLETEKDTEDENADFMIKQQRKAIEETKAVFPSLRERIKAALDNLESELSAAGQQGSATASNVDEITRAKEAIASAKASYREIA